MKSDSVRTPQNLKDYITKLYGSWYDPCPYNKLFNPRTDKDGLHTDWGAVTYCNPPYSKMKDWVIKAHHEWKKGKTILVLVKTRTLQTQYFKQCKGCTILLCDKKFAFPGYDTPPLFNNVLLVYEANKVSNQYGFLDLEI
jgi:hypothetical protein